MRVQARSKACVLTLSGSKLAVELCDRDRSCLKCWRLALVSFLVTKNRNKDVGLLSSVC